VVSARVPSHFNWRLLAEKKYKSFTSRLLSPFPQFESSPVFALISFLKLMKSTLLPAGVDIDYTYCFI